MLLTLHMLIIPEFKKRKGGKGDGVAVVVASFDIA